MRRRVIPIVLVSAFLGGCTAHHKPPTQQGTLADLHNVTPDVKEAETQQSVEQAMEHYRKFLDETPETPMTPEAIRRLADLQIEKQYGIHTGEGKPKPMPAPETAKVPATSADRTPKKAAAVAGAVRGESDQEFERRTTAESRPLPSTATAAASTEIPGAEEAPKGP